MSLTYYCFPYVNVNINIGFGAIFFNKRKIIKKIIIKVQVKLDDTFISI